MTPITKPDHVMHADLDGHQYNPLSELFQSLRPDIAILGPSSIDTLELTICHETNLNSSKQYKQSRYANLTLDTKPQFKHFKVTNYTIEVTTLGLITDVSQFCSKNLVTQLPSQIKYQILFSVISNSFQIYCNRNKNVR